MNNWINPSSNWVKQTMNHMLMDYINQSKVGLMLMKVINYLIQINR